MQLVVDKHIVALNVAVDDAEAVHVTEGCRDVLGDLDARLVGQIDVLPQMQHVVETALANVLEDDVDIRDLWNDTHQQHDVRMAQYTLHDYLVLNFLKQVISQPRVENLFNGDWRAVQSSDVYG